MAAKIMNPSHPLNSSFVAFLAGKEATKRQARKFLQANPWAAKAMKEDAQ